MTPIERRQETDEMTDLERRAEELKPIVARVLSGGFSLEMSPRVAQVLSENRQIRKDQQKANNKWADLLGNEHQRAEAAEARVRDLEAITSKLLAAASVPSSPSVFEGGDFDRANFFQRRADELHAERASLLDRISAEREALIRVAADALEVLDLFLTASDRETGRPVEEVTADLRRILAENDR